MTSETKNLYYLFKQGAVQEEPWEWSDLETLCREGQLSPDSLIFMPEENDWKKAADTDLAPLFEEARQSEGEVAGDETQRAETAEAYERALEQVREAPQLTGLLNVAEMAVALGDFEAAREHYQTALNQHPYHPRAAQEARRNLPPAEWKQLRYLARPPSIWGQVESIFPYPLACGPLYLAIPAVVLGALWWLPGGGLLFSAILYVWGIQVIRSSARLDEKPPLWHGMLAQPKDALLKPVLAGAGAVTELYLPFFIIAQIMVSSGHSPYPDALTVIRTSAFTTVLAVTIGLIYLPAVLVLASSSAGGLIRALNPVAVVRLIGKLEKEYMAAAGYIILMVCLLGMTNLLLEKIPVAGRFVATLLGVYIMLTSGLVLGRLQARFKEQIAD